MNIGLDLDNTIINYSDSYLYYANKLFKTAKEIEGNKQSIKKSIIENYNEHSWQKLQGVVYGIGMKHAKLFPEIYRFLWRAKNNNNNIYVISHKTLYGHFDNSKTNLRKKAIKFLKKHKLFGDLNIKLIDQIYFCDTQNMKIDTINTLKLDVFIDDLPEILNHPKFPIKTRKILFDPLKKTKLPIETVESYNQLSEKLYGDWSIKDFDNPKLLKLKLKKIKPIIGNGNSKIFCCENIHQKKICIKLYPVDEKHDRIRSEFDGLKKIYKKNKNVPKPIWRDKYAEICAFQWIEGHKIKNFRSTDLDLMLQFLENLHKRRNEEDFINFPYASAYCLSGLDIERQIEQRLKQLLKVKDKNLDVFLSEEFIENKNFLVQRAKKMMTEKLYNKELLNKELTLSPSDFGIHNALRQNKGNIVFLDFKNVDWLKRIRANKTKANNQKEILKKQLNESKSVLRYVLNSSKLF